MPSQINWNNISCLTSQILTFVMKHVPFVHSHNICDGQHSRNGSNYMLIHHPNFNTAKPLFGVTNTTISLMIVFHAHIVLLISLNQSTVSHKPLSIISIRNNNKITTVPTKPFDFATITINHKTTNRKTSKATNKQINNKISNRRISKHFNSNNIV